MKLNTNTHPIPRIRKTALPLSLLKSPCVIFRHRYFFTFHLYQFSITLKELFISVTSVLFILKAVMNNCIRNLHTQIEQFYPTGPAGYRLPYFCQRMENFSFRETCFSYSWKKIRTNKPQKQGVLDMKITQQNLCHTFGGIREEGNKTTENLPPEYLLSSLS
jgi:hypothetical protein